MKRLFSAPTTLNLELTELCNARCRHCYNFWRDESMGSVTLDNDTLDRIFDRIQDAGIFHVILSGGEPFAKFDLLEYAIRALTARGLSLSVNSNLMLATEERISRLLRAGLDHILTSLPSCDAATTDYVMAQVGAFERVTRGIRRTTQAGMRVSANMVVTRRNLPHVYKTARLASDLGCERLFVTRSVPPTYSTKESLQDYSLTPEETKAYLDDALRARDDFGIEVGSLVSYPLCFLGDLERYSDFVGRGCPSQSGHRMSVNANGDVHACVHEEEAYGNILESSVQEIYQGRMRRWHDGRFRYAGCAGCRYADVCESGCSMAARGIYGDHAAKDPLFVGPHAFTRHFQLAGDTALHEAIRTGMRFVAPARLRFRREEGFWLLNIRWGNSITIDDDVAAFLIKHWETGASFSLDDFGPERCELLANLYCKDAIVADDPKLAERFAGDRRQRVTGLSFNLEALEPA